MSCLEKVYFLGAVLNFSKLVRVNLFTFLLYNVF